jgi:serine/threonine protein kinase/tetratricopeptide (TPR) repeat protein
MSRVFLAEEVSLGRKVVVKVLPPDLAATVNVERFRREIQLAAKLQHPLIVPVLAAGISEGLPYYTMPFIEGESLRARLARSGELPVQEAARILRDVLSALSYAHEHGVVHRDIKPDNVLLTGHHAVVADFGVAKALSSSTNPGSSLTSLGVALGTPAYMAPEQATADPATDHRADLYAVGAMAYEMLTGHQVFSARSPQAMLAAHAIEKPEPIDKRRSSVPPALSSVVMRSLEKHAADRPQSAGEMLAELEAAVTPSGATVPTTMRPTIVRARFKTRVLLPTVLIGVVVIAGGIYAYGVRRQSASGNADASAQSATDPINAVAVIPFANTGGNPQDEYFSDGMTDELAHALSRLPRLRVAGRSSSYAFKGKSLPAQEIGKALNVSAVVEGSIRRSGQRLRVIAQLTSARNGQVMWSDTFESTASDLFQVQDDFTKAIVGALTPALGVKATADAASTSRGTDDQAAYELYLKGRYFFAKRGSSAVRHAITYFSEAATKDPKFARARAGISMAYGVLGFFEAAVRDSADSRALKNAELAVALDSSLGDAHLALANALTNYTRLRDADVEYQRALKLQPEDATTHQWYGDNLSMLGRVREALAEEQHAAALDPLSPIIAGEVALVLHYSRRFQEAVAASQRAIELDSTLAVAQQQLGIDYVFAGHAEKGVQVLERSYAREPGQYGTLGNLIFSYAASGRWADFSRLYHDLSRKSAQVADYNLLLAHLAVGDRQKALDVFEQLTRDGLEGNPYGCDPEFDLLQKEPRFLAVIHRFGAGLCPVTTAWPIKPPPAEFARTW